MSPEALPDPIAVAIAFTEILERQGVAYVIGGSLASSVHGEPRSTNDIDVVADLHPHQVAPLVRALEKDFYIDGDAVRRATDEGASFNAVHLGAVVKVDVFVVGADALDRERITLRVPVPVTGEGRHLFVDRAEMAVLRKLEWFRRGGEASERQWRDVVGILRIQRDRLDEALLDRWANRMGTADLLERAQREAR